MIHKFLALCILLFVGAGAAAQPRLGPIKVPVGGLEREALVYAPAKATRAPTPVVFAFHGHGGTAKDAANLFKYEKLWPEAIVVYMQGLPIPSKTDPLGKKNGWQHEIGQMGDRDLNFFDEMLARLKKEYKVDEKRVYATGQSNGGGFTYLLWAGRGETLAAVAPSSASSANRYLKKLRPKPVFHVAGEKDRTAPFENQQKLIQAIRKLNGCEEGKPWAKLATLYPSASGTPMVVLIHPGGHPFYAPAAPLIVRFFKEQAKK